MNKYLKKYIGEKVYLSPLNVDDYEIYTRWLNDETLSSGLGNFKSMISFNSEKEWIDSVTKSGGNHFAIVRLEDDVLLGTYGLDCQDQVSRKFHIGGFIGEKENRGKGYGTDALKLVTKYAFEILNAESIRSGIYSFNKASVKSAQKAGYTIAGKYRNSYFYNGKYNDEYLVEIIREDYLKQKSNL